MACIVGNLVGADASGVLASGIGGGGGLCGRGGGGGGWWGGTLSEVAMLMEEEQPARDITVVVSMPF